MSLAFTVRALDAGPIIACERVEVDDCIKVNKTMNIYCKILIWIF